MAFKLTEWKGQVEGEVGGQTTARGWNRYEDNYLRAVGRMEG